MVLLLRIQPMANLTMRPTIKEGTTIWVSNSMAAWEYINEAFLFGNDENIRFLSGHNCLYAYDVVLGIRKPIVDPDFDFGRNFNYTKNKWKSLVANYINYQELNEIREEVKKESSKGKSKVYNLALQFTNNHKHGKNCLLSMVFSHRYTDSKPTITVFLRASEVTKRLICDLLLFQRIGEYVYGDEKFQLVIHFNQLFNDDAVLLMYHVHSDVKDLLQGFSSPRAKNLLELLKKLQSKNPEDIKYKIHRRAAKVLHPELCKYPKTLAKDCTL